MFTCFPKYTAHGKEDDFGIGIKVIIESLKSIIGKEIIGIGKDEPFAGGMFYSDIPCSSGSSLRSGIQECEFSVGTYLLCLNGFRGVIDDDDFYLFRCRNTPQ